MNTRLRGTEGECRQTAGGRTETGEARPAPGHQNRSGSCDRDLGWRSATAADPAGERRAGPAAQSVPGGHTSPSDHH
jgi:hypothetical protein